MKIINRYNNLSAYLESAYEQKALLQKRVDLMRVDAETQLPSSFVVDYASAADKKANPELAGKVLLARAIMNLDEAITKP